MAYIANKPVRFDRTYAIGEVIPERVIDPKMARRLVEMGRILCVTLSDKEQSARNAATGAQDGGQGAEGADTQPNNGKGREGGAEGAENASSGEDNDVPAKGQLRKGKEQDSSKAAQPRAE